MDIRALEPAEALAAIRADLAVAPAADHGAFLGPLGDLHARVAGRSAAFDVDLFVATALDCLKAASLFQRMAFADVLADVGRIPPRLLDAMLADTAMVARPLIERARLSDGHLLKVMNADRTRATQLAIAARAGLGVSVTDRLVEEGGPEVHLTLAGNDRVTLSPAAFARFSDMAASQKDMDLALAQRSDLPIDIAKSLYQRISERASQRLSGMLARDLSRGRRPLALKVY